MGFVSHPKDGLRAVCVEFVQRCSIGNHHWIVCAGGRPQFQTREARDGHYRDVCCARGRAGCRYSVKRRA